MGSDCLYIYLKVMPAVRSDVIVHTHDVNLPFGIPRQKALERHIYWTEQYLLYAYMLDNPRVEILFGSAYSEAYLNDALQKFMGGKAAPGGGSIWYRLRGRPMSLSGFWPAASPLVILDELLTSPVCGSTNRTRPSRRSSR